MIIGYVDVNAEDGAVETHRDSYLLDNLTVVSVRKPFLAGGLLFGLGFVGFTLVFGDLLFMHEIGMTLGASLGALVAGLSLGQMKLLSRDLRGSEISTVIFGSFGELNKKRRDIVRAIAARKVVGSAE